MITQFKIYENVSPIEIGDYVLADLIEDNLYFSSNQASYMNSHLGEVVDITDDGTQFQLNYDNVDTHIDNHNPWVLDSEIVWYGKIKIDVDAIKQTDKYNL